MSASTAVLAVEAPKVVVARRGERGVDYEHPTEFYSVVAEVKVTCSFRYSYGKELPNQLDFKESSATLFLV